MGQLLEKDFSLVFQNKSCAIYYPNGIEVLSVRMNHRSFSLDLCNSRSNEVVLPSSVDVSELWHIRLGHFNFSSLIKMCKLNLMHNMPIIYDDGAVCEVCEKGK